MPQALIAPVIGAGASIFGSILGNRQKQQSSTTTPTLSPEMQAVMTKLLGYQQGILDDPLAGLQPIKTNALENVNRNFAGAPDRIQAQLSRRGYGSSGNLPAGLYGLESSRLGDLSDVDSKFAQIGADRQTQSAGQLGQLINSMKGSTTTGTMSGNPVGAGLYGAGQELGNVTALTTLAQLLKGGSGGGGSQNYSYDSGSAGFQGYQGG